MNKDLPDAVGGIVKPMLEPSGVAVDMFVKMAKVWKGIDVDFSFHTTADLPDKIKKNFIKDADNIDKATLKTDADREAF